MATSAAPNSSIDLAVQQLPPIIELIDVAAVPNSSIDLAVQQLPTTTAPIDIDSVFKTIIETVRKDIDSKKRSPRLAVGRDAISNRLIELSDLRTAYRIVLQYLIRSKLSVKDKQRSLRDQIRVAEEILADSSRVISWNEDLGFRSPDFEWEGEEKYAEELVEHLQRCSDTCIKGTPFNNHVLDLRQRLNSALFSAQILSRAIDTVYEKIHFTEEEESTLNEGRIEKIINAKPKNLAEGHHRYMYILPEEAKNLIISFIPRQYKSKLRLQDNTPRFIYDMNITDSPEERIQSVVDLNEINLECTIYWRPFGVGDADDHMMNLETAPGFGLLLKKFNLLARTKRRMKRLSISLGQEGALLVPLLEAGGECLPYLKEIEVRVSDETLSESQGAQITRLVKEAVRCKGSGAVLNTATLSCHLLRPFANAGLLESVESLAMAESGLMCPRNFLQPISSFSALRILDLYELHGFKFESNLLAAVNLGSVETLRVQKSVLHVFSKSGKITSLGVKGHLAGSDSAEALLQGIKNSFPELRCLELGKTMLNALAEPTLGGMELLPGLDTLHIDGGSNMEQVVQIVAKRYYSKSLKNIKLLTICGTSFDHLNIHKVSNLVQYVYCLEKVDCRCGRFYDDDKFPRFY